MIQKNKLSRLEAIRGFAAVYVVFHHLFSAKFLVFNIDISYLFRFGQEAVILFFILSGIVIGYSHERSKDKTFKLYFLKRFLRIYIPLLLVFITNYIIISISQKGLYVINIQNFIGNLFMLQDMKSIKPNVIVTPFLSNLPLWSLSYEWWFYMIYYFVYSYLKKNKSIFVYVLSIISGLTYLIYPNFLNRELMYLVIWWTGVEIAKLYTKNKEYSFKNLKIPLLSILSIIIILLFNIYLQNKLSINSLIGVTNESPWIELRHFVSAFLFISGSIIWKKIKWKGFNITLGLFERFAPISYGIYISHWFLIINAQYFNNLITNYALRLVAYFAICFGFSYFIEQFIYAKLKNILMDIYFKRNKLIATLKLEN